MSKNPTLVLVLGFIAGCGAAVVAPLIIPPAHAQTTQRWEGYCVGQEAASYRGAVPNLNELVNAAGREGWEPYMFAQNGNQYHGILCFKRPAP